MAMAQQIDSQNGPLPEDKVVGNYVAVHRLLEPMFHDMNQAEVRCELLGPYLMVVYDELSTISRKYMLQDAREDFLREWTLLEDRYGPLHAKTMLLATDEWHERKRALIAMRESLGMGTSAPTQGKNLHPPLRMAEYHRRCAKGCKVKQNLVESRHKWQ